VSRMRRWTIGVGIAVLILAALIGTNAAAAADAKIKIGITQIVEHPALDAARQGFIDELAAFGYDENKVSYDLQNAQGDFATAQTIAEKFASGKVDLVLAIATPTAQATANVIRDIPILITAVTDPVAAGLVESIERPGTNVTGTSDLTPVAKQLELLKTIAPQAKRVGVLYNPGEANSLVQLDLARKAAAGLGFSVVEVPVDSSSSVYQAAQSTVGKVDALYVPTDNTVVSALESVVIVAENAKLPLIVGETDSVRRGALGTISIDYYALGRQTGRMALEILEKNANPAEMPIQYLDDVELVLNLGAAERMGVELPAELVAQAGQIFD